MRESRYGFFDVDAMPTLGLSPVALQVGAPPKMVRQAPTKDMESLVQHLPSPPPRAPQTPSSPRSRAASLLTMTVKRVRGVSESSDNGDYAKAAEHAAIALHLRSDPVEASPPL